MYFWYTETFVFFHEVAVVIPDFPFRRFFPRIYNHRKKHNRQFPTHRGEISYYAIEIWTHTCILCFELGIVPKLVEKKVAAKQIAATKVVWYLYFWFAN